MVPVLCCHCAAAEPRGEKRWSSGLCHSVTLDRKLAALCPLQVKCSYSFLHTESSLFLGSTAGRLCSPTPNHARYSGPLLSNPYEWSTAIKEWCLVQRRHGIIHLFTCHRSLFLIFWSESCFSRWTWVLLHFSGLLMLLEAQVTCDSFILFL